MTLDRSSAHDVYNSIYTNNVPLPQCNMRRQTYQKRTRLHLPGLGT